MKFSRKMWLIMLLEVTKNQGFAFSLGNRFLEKLPGGRYQINSLSLSRVNRRRVPFIPPIQIEINSYLTLQEKVKHCRVIDNNSQIPDLGNYCTNEELNSIKFAYTDILKILKNLDINNSHWHHN